MSGLFTVEDVNGTVYRNQGFYWHMIDTSKISSDSDYTDIQYDFCKVSRSTNGSNITYTFEIINSNWSFGYYIRKANGDYIGTQGSYNPVTNKLTFTTTEQSINLFLYMGLVKLDDYIYYLSYVLKNNKLDYDGPVQSGVLSVDLIDLATGDEFTIDHTVSPGYNLISFYPHPQDLQYCGYLLVNLIKTDFEFNCNQTLTVGKINKVSLGAYSQYKPGGSKIGSYTPNIKVIYNNKTIPVEYDTDDYYFNLDLTEKTEPGKVKFKVIIEDNEVLNYTETKVTLESDYELVTTLAGLTSACDSNGSTLIKLGADITLTGGNMPVKHDIKIVGNDKTLTCTGGRLWVREGNTLNIEDLTFTTGKTCILQNIHTTVELDNCVFINNKGYSGTTYNYTNNKGS